MTPITWMDLRLVTSEVAEQFNMAMASLEWG